MIFIYINKGGYWYKGIGQVWSIIAPAVADDINEFFFASSNYFVAFAEGWTINGFSEVFIEATYDYSVFSHSPAYYNKYAYYHFGTDLIRINEDGIIENIYSGDEINVDSSNINNTISISVKNNVLFVVGEYLCAFRILSSIKLWCNKMNGGSLQGTTPSIDDNENIVYIYDNGYIYGYDQINGTLKNTFGNGNITNQCNTEYGCISSQPIITPNTIFWADGIGVLIFDKQTKKNILTIQPICNNFFGVGNSIAFYDQYLFVSCRERIVGYAFE